jgi:glucokinase-like ROK family protein
MFSTRTADQTLVREINLSLLLNTLRTSSPLSRAALAMRTGLNKTTVSRLVAELLDAQFVREVGYHDPGAGRPGILLELNPHAGCIIAAEIGVDFFTIILANFGAEILWRYHANTADCQDQQAILDRVIQALDDAKAECEQRQLTLLGIAIGLPGLVDVNAGTLIFAPNLGWYNLPIRELLEPRFHCPVFADNEAKMAALGEIYFGAARGCDNVLYIHAAVGLAGGFVSEERIQAGRMGFAGQFGHMTLDPEGPQCKCGNRGCWETFVSQNTVFRHVREAVETGRPSLLSHLTAGQLDKLTMQLVTSGAELGDVVANEALQQMGEYLGIGIANLINANNPEMVVIGGTSAVAGKFLLPSIKRVISARALGWSANGVKLLVATNGADASVMGGIALVYQHVLNRPLLHVERNGSDRAHGAELTRVRYDDWTYVGKS